MMQTVELENRQDSNMIISPGLPRQMVQPVFLPPGLFLPGLLLLGLLLLASLLAGCSILPDWTPREYREVAVTVHYDRGTGERSVGLPSSTPDLLILELTAEPKGLRQTFSNSRRELQLPADPTKVRVRCRYRMYRRHDSAGRPLPWREACELFPGAVRIDRSTDVSGVQPEG